jgi:hypothetical protein
MVLISSGLPDSAVTGGLEVFSGTVLPKKKIAQKRRVAAPTSNKGCLFN